METKLASTGRPRAKLFRALGENDPPEEVVVAGETYRRIDILKHDSWAATAIYQGRGKKIVCKFNRQQSIFGLSMKWLGRLLGQHEAKVLKRLQDLPNLPRWSGDVCVNGKALANAVAHDYIEGHPLGADERVSPQFFPRLKRLLGEIHRRRMAYVDLHKRENILVGRDGEPYLLDFQISFLPSHRWPGNTALARCFLEVLQKADFYHLDKHVRKQPGATAESGELPWFIRCHRVLGQPFRWLRRQLLVRLGIRTGKGRATSEHFAEDAIRHEQATRNAA